MRWKSAAPFKIVDEAFLHNTIGFAQMNMHQKARWELPSKIPPMFKSDIFYKKEKIKWIDEKEEERERAFYIFVVIFIETYSS